MNRCMRIFSALLLFLIPFCHAADNSADSFDPTEHHIERGDRDRTLIPQNSSASLIPSQMHRVVSDEQDPELQEAIEAMHKNRRVILHNRFQGLPIFSCRRDSIRWNTQREVAIAALNQDVQEVITACEKKSMRYRSERNRYRNERNRYRSERDKARSWRAWYENRNVLIPALTYFGIVIYYHYGSRGICTLAKMLGEGNIQKGLLILGLDAQSWKPVTEGLKSIAKDWLTMAQKA